MTIGILLHPYDEDKPAGLGRYIFELSKALIESDTENKYILFVKKKPRTPPAIKGNNWRLEVLDNSPLWLGLGFRRAAKVDVYIFNTPVLPLFLPKGRVIVIALDFAYAYLPSGHARDAIKKEVLFWYHGRSLRKADHIIAISKTTQEEIVKLYGISKEKISVVYPGFNKICGLTEEPVATPKNFFLFVGVLKPRKNPHRVIEAFAEFYKEHKDYSLMVAGKGSGPYYEAMRSYARAHGVEKAIIFTGFITDAQLAYLYKRARAFVFPSIFEGGFALPVLEAMDCGVPVITSGRGPYESLEETTGDAALLVHPLRVDEIKNAMERVATDEPGRSVLIQKGKSRAAYFSWEKSAEGLMDAIQKVHGKQ